MIDILGLHGEGEEEDVSLGWRIGQIFIVLAVGTSGLLLNLFLYKREINKVMAIIIQLLKGIGAGTILAVALVHMLGESSESLEVLNEKTEYEAWNMVFCMIALYFYSIVDFILKRSTDKNCIEFNLKDLVFAEDGHCIQAANDESENSQEKDNNVIKDPEGISGTARLISEISILSHSILVGVIVGLEASTSLLIATCFHQLLEGFAYANLLSGMKNSALKWTLVSAYSLTTAIGQVIGIVLAEDEDFVGSDTGAIVVGALSAFCSGLMLYTAIVHMLSHWVTHNKQLLGAPKLYGFITYIGVAIGIGAMALIGKWA